MGRIVIFTDLDGSLLDAITYSYEAAEQALATIQQKDVPLILVSSKTRSEIEPLRLSLDNRHPFIVENGGALFIPKDYFPFPVGHAMTDGDYQVIEIGTPYAMLRTGLKKIGEVLGCRLRGFGDLSAEEVARLTGLSPVDALLAKQREYDEPFMIEEQVIAWSDLLRAADTQGLRCTRGGRFYHLMGSNDKGTAGKLLAQYYRRLAHAAGHTLTTIGLGDSLNDLPLLATVDYPILVQKPDRSYDPNVHLPHLTRADGIGPVGWNRSLIDLLQIL
ncbi:MAG: HAD-IIB family hydrolase [Nitrospira sp.]|jgi:mannosyl-3-phosphoglycerate phosphatase|nr:MAG: HAD-IIB family hydrolase [Nitrospira sp.]